MEIHKCELLSTRAYSRNQDYFHRHPMYSLLFLLRLFQNYSEIQMMSQVQRLYSDVLVAQTHYSMPWVLVRFETTHNIAIKWKIETANTNHCENFHLSSIHFLLIDSISVSVLVTSGAQYLLCQQENVRYLEDIIDVNISSTVSFQELISGFYICTPVFFLW